MSFFEVFKQELRTIFSDFAIVLTIIGGVLLYAFLYPQPYMKQNVTAIPIAVVDNDRSDISRDIAFHLQANPQIGTLYQLLSQKEALEYLKTQKIKGYVVIPKDFKRDMLLLKQPKVKIGVDGSYFLVYGGVVESSLGAIVSEIVKQKVASSLKQQVPLSLLQNYLQTFKVEIINLFNPNSSYTQYVLPAVFVLILQQTLLIGLGIVGGGINEQAYKGYDYDVKTQYVIFSRYIIFLILFLFHFLFYFGFVFDLFDIYHSGKLDEIVFFGVIYFSAVIALGLFFGALMKQREIATPLVLFSSLILVFSVGFVWPKEMIPFFVIYLSEFFPSTPGIEGFLKLNQLGANIKDIEPSLYILIIQIVVYMFLAFSVLEYKRKNKKTTDI